MIIKKKGKTILVIEDESLLQDAIKLKLENKNFNYLPATSAEEALNILKTKKPDLIWLDLLLPGMGGFAFLEKIRGDSKYKDLPVVVVSVSSNKEKIHKAFELNVVDYIAKNEYKIGDIVERVENLVAKN